MANTIDDLKEQALTIKNASQTGENTANRVGTLFYDIVDNLIAGKYEFRYKNSKVKPTKPADGSDGTTGGWAKEPTDPHYDEGELTWMTQCYYSYVNGYGKWSTAIRITGANGKNGEDGKDVEFVYTRNNTGKTLNPPIYDDAGNPVDKTDDWTGYDQDGVFWTDNPQGVDEDHMYEYVCVRTKETGAVRWNAFSEPAIWSKWGEKGRDGDGYEYIFFITIDENTTPNINYDTWFDQRTQTYKTKNDDEYLPYSTDGQYSTRWSDEPNGVNATNKVEWTSFRKKISKSWSDFSEPKVWSKWAKDGSNGTHNILSGVLIGEGWKSSTTVDGTFDHDVTVDGDGWMHAQNGDSYLQTPEFSLEEGEYTLSLEAEEAPLCYLYNMESGSLISELSMEGSDGRYSSSFRCQALSKVCIRIGANKIRYPQLEIGNIATDFNTDSTEVSSRITQTADSIELKVKNTGIDIDEKEINLIAGKVNFKDSEGNPNPYMSIGADGKLVVDSIQATNGNFGGIVKTSLMYAAVSTMQNESIGNDRYRIDLENYPAYMYLVPQLAYSTAHIILPNPISYNGVELRFYLPLPSTRIGWSAVLETVNGEQSIVFPSLTSVEATEEMTDAYDLSLGRVVTLKSMNSLWYVIEGYRQRGISDTVQIGGSTLRIEEGRIISIS